MKAVIFARVSSKDQEDGHSLDAQIQACFEYAIKKNYKVIEQFRVVESSTASGRPEFSKMVEYVRKQREKVVVLCYCVDRLQRDFDEQYLELQKLIKQDKKKFTMLKASLSSIGIWIAQINSGRTLMCCLPMTTAIRFPIT
jgi:site-specific DNA recombinase